MTNSTASPTAERFSIPFLVGVALAIDTVYGAIFAIYLHEKTDRALIRQYPYMGSLFSFVARALHSSPALAHRDMRIDGLRW